MTLLMALLPLTPPRTMPWTFATPGEASPFASSPM
jgi:hypothetical protein